MIGAHSAIDHSAPTSTAKPSAATVTVLRVDRTAMVEVAVVGGTEVFETGGRAL